MTAALAPAGAAGAPSATVPRTPLPATGPISSTVHPADIAAAGVGIDKWLRDISGNYITLDRVTMVAGAVPVIGNIMALVDVISDVIEVAEKVNAKETVEIVQWVSLGVNFVGVIPLPPGMAAARMSFRPTIHLLKEKLLTNGAVLAEATIQLLVAGLADVIVGELETFATGFQSQLGDILEKAAAKSDEVIDDLVLMLQHLIGEVPEGKRRASQALTPEKVVHDPEHESKWSHMLAAVCKAAATVEGYAERQIAKALSDDAKATVGLAIAGLGETKLLFRKQLHDLGSTTVHGSIAMLLQWLLAAIKGRKIKLNTTVSGEKGTRVQRQKSGEQLETTKKQPPAHKAANDCKNCVGETIHSINLATGAESFVHTDFVLDAPLPIEWSRIYRSDLGAYDQGCLGARWLTPYTTRIDVTGDGRKKSLVYHAIDGRSHRYPWLEVGHRHRDPVEEITLTRVSEDLLLLDSGKPLPVDAESPRRETYQLAQTVALKAERQGIQHFRLVAIHTLQSAAIGLRYDHVLSDGPHAGEQVLSDILSKQGDTTIAHVGVKPDAFGRIAELWEIKDGTPGRQLAGYIYDPHGDLVEAQDENAASWQYTYEHHLVTRYSDRTGRGINLRYDFTGDDSSLSAKAKAVHEWADDGSLDTKLEWDKNIRLTYVTDALGGETRVFYDIEGYTYRVTHPDGNDEWFMRDETKNVVQHIHPDGGTDVYRYDADGNLIEQVRPDDTHIHFAYDAAHRLTGILDPDGGRWLRSYDNHGLLVEEIDPLGHKTEYAYDKAGRPVEAKDAKSGKKKLAYTPTGQLASYTDCSGRQTTWAYDSRGRLFTRTDSLGQVTKYRYTPVTQAALDQAGTRFSTSFPLRSFPGQLESVEHADETIERLAHDAEGRLLEHNDALDRRTEYRYDAAGRIAERQDAAGHKLCYAWDKLGRLATLRNENGQPYSFKYDPVGRLLEETGFDGKTTEYRYGPTNGILTEVADGGVTTRLDFDLMGRLRKRQVTTGGREQTETFGYYPGGKLGDARNEHARLLYFYDDAGNLTREHHEYLGLKKTAVWHHRYDELNQRVGTTRPDGHKVEWLTYGSGHIHGLVLDGQEVVGFERDALHREVHRDQANGLQQTQAFDAAGRLVRQRLSSTKAGLHDDNAWERQASLPRTPTLGAQPALERRYRYDKAGQLVGIGDTRRGMLDYRYDPVGRLLQAIAGAHPPEVFDFDPAGNIRMPSSQRYVSVRERAELPKVLDNLLKEYAGTHYTWDERGNLVERTHNGSKTEFEWDGFNRMTRATTVEGITRFTYDPLGRRIGKASELPSVGDQGIDSTATETVYGWDGDTLAFESNGDSQRNGHRGSTVHYVHEAGSFVPLLQARIEGVIDLSPTTDKKALKAANFGAYDIRKDPLWNGDLEAMPKPFAKTDIAFYQCDHLGTPMELTDHDGTVAWEANYNAWGEAKQVISEAAERAGLKNPIRFQGQYFDEETGLHYNRHRYYDPLAGRFVSKDPIRLAGDSNFHRYAPNPLEWVDPFGLSKRSGTQNATSNDGQQKQSCRTGRTSSAARREVMRRAGIPTSSVPAMQRVVPGWEQYMYIVKTGEGDKYMIVSHHPADKEHACPHWHAAEAMTDRGEIRMNNMGAWKYQSGGAAITHDLGS